MDRMIAMQTFVTVVDAGSFSAAARLLNVGQPAVSKSIAQLEATLGVRLLMRSTRGLIATESGQQFYEHARRAIEAADEAERAARGAGAGLTGKLRVCAPVTLASIHVVPRLKSFLAEHPGLDIDVLLDDRNIDLLESGVDVAFRLGPQDDSTMTARRIACAARSVVGTPAYFAAAGTPTTPAALVAHQAIVYQQKVGGTHWSFTRGTNEASVTVKGRIHVSAAEGVRAAVLAHLGIAIASQWMFAPELANGAVRPVLTDWLLPPIELWAVFPTGRMSSAKARAFADFMAQALADPLFQVDPATG